MQIIELTGKPSSGGSFWAYKKVNEFILHSDNNRTVTFLDGTYSNYEHGLLRIKIFDSRVFVRRCK